MKRRKILLVDDSKTVLMMERMILMRGGYDTVTAADGEEGVSKAKQEKPDAILMDVVMPRMNGFDACRALREQAETRDTPIIMVTTKGDEDHVEVGYESGCTDYITKPINSGELILKLQMMLGN
jgi:DNA-binding response OmpR family regulator